MTEDVFVKILQNAVEKVKSEEDPVELNQYRKLYKKTVPFALRIYVAAYLAKNGMGDSRRDSFRSRRENQGRFKKERVPENRETRSEIETRPETKSEREAPTPRVSIDESLASTVFISIGRNRRVFPRDLVGLVVQTSGIDRSRVGDIRVLDNYSFIQLYTEDCEKVIAALDGIEYRGRKLTVSYSRKKNSEEASEDSIDLNKTDDNIETDSIDSGNIDTQVNYSSEAGIDSEIELDPEQDAIDRAAFAKAEKAVAEAAAKSNGLY